MAVYDQTWKITLKRPLQERLSLAEGMPDCPLLFLLLLCTLYFNKGHHKKQLCILTNDVFPFSFSLFAPPIALFLSCFFSHLCFFLLSFSLSAFHFLSLFIKCIFSQSSESTSGPHPFFFRFPLEWRYSVEWFVCVCLCVQVRYESGS